MHDESTKKSPDTFSAMRRAACATSSETGSGVAAIPSRQQSVLRARGLDTRRGERQAERIVLVAVRELELHGRMDDAILVAKELADFVEHALRRAQRDVA